MLSDPKDYEASAGSVDAVEAGGCAQISKADITKAIIDFDRLDFANRHAFTKSSMVEPQSAHESGHSRHSIS